MYNVVDESLDFAENEESGELRKQEIINKNWITKISSGCKLGLKVKNHF